MEARKITIVDTRTDNIVTIMSAATTLGELKDDLTANGISYAGMDFYEGLSHTSMSLNSAQLPKDVMRRGVPTNELVFQLSTQNKKIKSGAMKRAEVYSQIKEIIAKDPSARLFFSKYGNYTNLSTIRLVEMLESYNASNMPTVPKETCTSSVAKGEPNETNCQCEKLKTAFIMLIDYLFSEDIIDCYMYSDITDTLLPGSSSLRGSKSTSDKLESPYSEEEIFDMFN